ncbi:purine-cytosine permease [Nadsonia fulvescens var. elongata DSM 6958]|uniref:Purine-cytosine permease n=1 Tax=Nadsonia fulvescens var. elongata DSM 6958 TaxID=857566 RepID=A0A1E3PRK1_9ASCO|nr:purine-cytosine permease [Nadsonia fulvescens var. elongata DSM 6958]
MQTHDLSDIEKAHDSSIHSASSSCVQGEAQEKYADANGFVRFFNKTAEVLNAEIRGIDRVPEEEQTDTSLWGTASMWLAANMVIATFALGALGPKVFGLGFWDSVICIVFFTILGILPVAIFSTFGPVSGLRQMGLTRFWWGYQGVRLAAFINCVACIGWCAVNTMVAAQMLSCVNNGGLPPWASVLIVTAGTVVITFFGYHVVHLYEMFSWIPNFIIFLIIIACLAKSHSFTPGVMDSGPIEAGKFLSMGSSIFGFATGWSSFAADYTVYMKRSTSKKLVFASVIAGLSFPLIFVMILGAAAMSCALNNEVYMRNYEAHNIGGLFYGILVDESLHGFGQFCVVLLSLSTIANNVPNMYSLGLSAQAVWSQFRKFPRIFWTLLGNGISVAIAIPAFYHFESVMHNFMIMIGYWLAAYQAICLSEHFIYRRDFSGYDFDQWEDPSKLPIGFAAIFGFCCGVAGACIGMSQQWWTGPIASLIGKGGDVGFELSFGFAFVGFNAVRFIERKYLR